MKRIRITIRPFYLVVLVVLLLVGTILRPFIGTILGAIVISYVSYPLYAWLNSKTNKKTVSALVTTIILVFIITVPLIFAINALSKEIFSGYIMAKQTLTASTGQLSCASGVFCNLLQSMGLTEPAVNNFLTDTLGKAAASIFSALTNYLISLPKIMANIFIALFLTYYLLKDGKGLIASMKLVIPLKPHYQERLLKRFNDVTYGVVYGNIIVALIQGLLTAVGFFLFGIASPLIWGVVTVFTSLVPFLGAFIVWLPASLFLILSGYNSGDGTVLMRGIGLFLYGMLFISSIDNILKPKLIGQRAKLHPALVLLGVIGGLTVLGMVGIIIGPVLIGLAATLIELISKEKSEAKNLI